MQTSATDRIATSITTVRNQRVILDSDIAALYGVPTKALVQAARRNAERFPADFMFQLTDSEWESLRSQIVTSKNGQDEAIADFMRAIRDLVAPAQAPKRPIGFIAEEPSGVTG